MEVIFGFILNNIWSLFGVAGIGGLLSLLLKKYVTDEVMAGFAFLFYRLGRGIGITVTLGLAKWKWTKGVWNNILEPYVIILVRGILMNLLNGIVSGLESDNK